MERDELLRVFHSHRLARFKIENDFVLRAMILEHPADVLHARNDEEEAEEQCQADHAVHHVYRESAVQRWDRLAELRRQKQRHKLVHEQEKQQRKRERRGHHPAI